MRAFSSRLFSTLRATTGLLSVQGPRPSQEDRCHVTSLMNNRYILASVFDGHAGPQVSHFLNQFVPKGVEAELTAGRSASAALDRVYRAAEALWMEAVVKNGRILAQDGSCAISSLIDLHEGVIVTANVGDCRAVRTVSGRFYKNLSVDHTPEIPTERERLASFGSSVVMDGCWRVSYAGNGGLAISRAFGDAFYKYPRPTGVTAVPEIFTERILPEEGDHPVLVVVASDGVFGHGLTSEEAIDCVNEHASGPEGLDKACKMLVEKSLKRGTWDNVSVVVVKLER